MSGKTTVREYLEEEQKRAYEQAGYSVEKFTKLSKIDRPQRLEKFLEKQGDFMSEETKDKVRKGLQNHYEEIEKMELPSKYENPSIYGLINNLAIDIELGSKIINFSDIGFGEKITEAVGKRRPIFASMPTGNVNARSRYFPASKEYLVILEDQLFIFCHLLSKIVARAIPLKERKQDKLDFSHKKEDILDNLEKNKQILQRFQELILAYLIQGKPSKAPQYILEAPFDIIASSLRLGMEIFVLSHEYGHVVLGHLESSQTSKCFLSNRDVMNMTFLWDQELDADSIGLALTLAAMREKGWDFSLGYMGSDLFFSCYELIERGLCILRNGNDDYYWRGGKIDGPVGAHPPAEVRRQNLREYMTEKFPGESIEPSKSNQIILEELWKNTRPILEKYHNEKGRPSTRWALG